MKRRNSNRASFAELRMFPLLLATAALLLLSAHLFAGPSLPGPSTAMFPLNGTNYQAVGDLGMGGHSVTNVATVQATNVSAQSYQGSGTNAFDANGAATASQSAAEAYAADADHLSSGTVNISRLPMIYAVIDIPMGGGDSAQAFTDFVLKATRTNFGANGSPELVYWYVSADPEQSSYPSQILPGGLPLVYYTDSGAADPRTVYQEQPGSEGGIYEEVNARNGSQPGNVSDVSVSIPGTTSDISPTNNDLVWVYQRFSGGSAETDVYGRPIWRLATAKWVSSPIHPNN